MIQLKVAGMTCGHCVAAVRQAVGGVPGARDVTVDLARGEVSVGGEPDIGAVRAAIAEEGYEVEAA